MSRVATLAMTFVLITAACTTAEESTPTATTVPEAAASPTTTTSPASTAAPTSTTRVPATTTSLPAPVEGWTRLGVDPSVLGTATVTDGTTDGTRVVLVGCRARGFPVWWTDQAAMSEWKRADGPSDVNCLTQVVTTPFGLFARGGGIALRSDDGEVWEPLDLTDDLGPDASTQLGYLQAILPSPSGDRVTLQFSRAAEGESRIATLVTTTDGETWERASTESSMLFDNSTMSSVIVGGDGLLVAGASPGGEFVPTAAVFTSADGLAWRRVTPSSSDFDNKRIRDLRLTGSGFVAVGGDMFVTGLMTAWTSPDGITWTRSPHPDEQTDPSVAHMTAEAVTETGGSLWAVGTDYDARRSENKGVPALWSSIDGTIWERQDFENLAGTVPFIVVETPQLTLGVWPPPNSTAAEPLQLFVGPQP